ncbi:hypothetical protein [Brevibacillus brevis]|uniref:hypothetical protein n=1 Tax=Brevibacillus brevis TaxID=1393 RepID=UPI0007D8C3D0|nr:hypothetical protein [Brevibacillus brevis]
MKTFEDLKEMGFEDLKQVIEKRNEEIKQDHDMVVLMGSLGVSPKHMNMYFDSVRKIQQMN